MIGYMIRKNRQEKCWYQKDLAQKLNVTTKIVSFYENEERTPPLDMLLKLSEGHSKYEQTANTYSHITESFSQEELDKLDK